MAQRQHKHVEIGTLQPGAEFWTADWDCTDEKWGEIVPGHDGVVLAIEERRVHIKRTRRKEGSKQETLEVPHTMQVIPR
jgi:hypothetical protein